MTPDWERVGEAIERRRQELRLSKAEVQRRANVSQPTLDGYLAGAPIRWASKIRGICDALEWTPDSIERLAAGGDAVPTKTTLTDVEARLRSEIQALSSEIEHLRARFDAEVARLDAEIAKAFEELRALKADMTELGLWPPPPEAGASPTGDNPPDTSSAPE